MGGVNKTMSIVGIGGGGVSRESGNVSTSIKIAWGFFHFLVYVTCEGVVSRGNFRIIVFLSK